MNQEAAILNHLKEGKSITPLEALERYGCFRLGARIFGLKKQGYDIDTEIIHENGKHFAKYSMKKVSADSYKVQSILFDNNHFTAA